MTPEEKETETVEQQEDKPTETVALSAEELQRKLDELTRHAKNKEEEAARVQKKLEKFEQAEAERKQAEMTEVEKATAKAKAAEEEKANLAKEIQTLKLQRAFEDKVRDAKLDFRNSLAAKDAFNALVELMGEDTEITDDHIKQLTSDRDYLFGKPDPNLQNNDASKKGKANQNVLTQELVNQKRNMIGPL